VIFACYDSAKYVHIGTKTLRGISSRAAVDVVSKYTLNMRTITGIWRRTLHGLFSSNPSGAEGLSVCPRRYPVSLLSRSITVFGLAMNKFAVFVGITLL
jgi:hypothetical protein